MAAPTVIASAKASTRADGDTVGITVTHGMTLADGDILYAFLTRSDDLGDPWGGFGSTWAQVDTDTGTAGNDMLTTLLRRVIVTASGEPSSYTFRTATGAGGNTQVAILVQVRGANTASPEEILQTIAYGSNDFTPGTMALDATVSENDSLALAFHAACMNDGVSGKTGGAPSGMTLIDYEEEIFAGALGSFAEAAWEARNAGTLAVQSWTGTPNDATSEWHCCVIAVKPAVVATVPRHPAVNFQDPALI